jgi:hypothetical protein
VATTAVHYTEHHDVTNQFGLFSLVVGEGLVDLGDFNKVPWIRGYLDGSGNQE